jgi:spore maturation protein CgeB
MKILYFTHSLVSCWNHGNAHFLRGVLRELIRRGHEVVAYEPEHGWSLRNLLDDHGAGALDCYRAFYPELRSRMFGKSSKLGRIVDGADLVIVHEWNRPELVAALGALRLAGGRFLLLFHDTHHRAVSDPDAIGVFDHSGYDGVLAFGEALAEVYRGWGWGKRVFVWHEAADIRHFRPPGEEGKRSGLVWIGNWGDGERTRQLRRFLLGPARRLRLPLDIFGVRYPPAALALLEGRGARYRGWLPNAAVPETFASYLATVHVPRVQYSTLLPGIPTIRVFEALACGIPLACAPWEDREGLFRQGRDYLSARDGHAMTRILRDLRGDPALRRSLAASGLETIRARHSCGHRADELLAIAARLADRPGLREAA